MSSDCRLHVEVRTVGAGHNDDPVPGQHVRAQWEGGPTQSQAQLEVFAVLQAQV